ISASLYLLQSLDRSKPRSTIHPLDDFVMAVIEHAYVVSVLDREEFGKRKLARKLTTHAQRNDSVVGTVKDRHLRSWVPLLRFGEICTVVVTFDKQSRDPSTDYGRRFLTQGRERRDEHDALDVVPRGEIERDGGA